MLILDKTTSFLLRNGRFTRFADGGSDKKRGGGVGNFETFIGSDQKG